MQQKLHITQATKLHITLRRKNAQNTSYKTAHNGTVHLFMNLVPKLSKVSTRKSRRDLTLSPGKPFERPESAPRELFTGVEATLRIRVATLEGPV